MSRARNPFFVIWLTVLVALILMIIPMPDDWPRWALRMRPEVLVLVCIFWNIRFPERFSVGSAWVAGLFLDVLYPDSIMGQRALCLALVVAVSHRFHRQFRAYTPMQQLTAIGLLVTFYTLVLLWIDGMSGHPLTSTFQRWVPILTSLILWPIVALVLGLLQQRFRVQS